jgi:four helix bundle protein
MRSHKDLDVYQDALSLSVSVIQLTKKFPVHERYGLTSQVSRSAVSIPSNIAEGAARQYNKEFIQFLYISLGSAAELETQLTISQRLSFITKEELDSHVQLLASVTKRLYGLVKYVRTK